LPSLGSTRVLEMIRKSVISAILYPSSTIKVATELHLRLYVEDYMPHALKAASEIRCDVERRVDTAYFHISKEEL
jgi:hypothetical protein